MVKWAPQFVVCMSEYFLHEFLHVYLFAVHMYSETDLNQKPFFVKYLQYT